MSGNREVIFEFLRVGAALKVSAIDTATGLEAVIVGDPAAGEEALKRLARQKLDYLLAKRKGAGG
jgi:hypothetical protein